MHNINIPVFIKNMGHQIIGCILNIDDEDAKGVVEGKRDLNSKQSTILQAYIQLCTQIRIQSVKQGNEDISVLYELSHKIQNDRHIFNLWREQFGGLTPEIDESDKVVYIT